MYYYLHTLRKIFFFFFFEVFPKKQKYSKFPLNRFQRILSMCLLRYRSHQPFVIRFINIFWRWSSWPFVYRYLLHITRFLSACWDLYCQLCLLLLHNPKDWYVVEIPGVNKDLLSTGVPGIRSCELRYKSLKKVPLQDLCANFINCT